MASLTPPPSLAKSLFLWHVLPAFAAAILAGGLIYTTPSSSTLQFGLLSAISFFGLVSVMYYLWRHDRVMSLATVEQQLASLFLERNHPKTSSRIVKTILGNNPVAIGWNQLADRLRERRWNEAIEQSLQQSATEGASHDIVYRMARCHTDGLVVTDRQGIIRFSNPAWSNLMDIEDQDSCVGQSIYEHLKLSDKQDGVEIQTRLQTSSSPQKHFIKLAKSISDGVWRLARIPLDGRAHDTEAFVWILRDHTQQALAEDARDKFVGAATHELRTPLANILAYADTLANATMSLDTQREFFNTISSEAQRLNRLLDQLLNLQQMEAGALTLNRSPCDLLRAVEEACSHIKPLAEARSLSLDHKTPPHLPALLLDKEKIVSLLINLLGNAVKYTLPGGEIRLIVEYQADEICIHIEDTGIGIPLEDQAKIFERFYRCQDERTADQIGNGLGLALAREVARLHGGDLTVQSQPNRGSRFTLHLPNANCR